ncbi:MAG: efflux RND transporter periplasmic adaptor subunit, partial [Kangiellaceae bacterium]|nr:efflux RND transporter periplasmic adaptor subunit [Kangiellaceae bacterium]
MHHRKIVLLCGAALATFLLTSCKEKVEEDSSPVIRPVKIISIKDASETQVNQFPAVIGASRLSELSINVGGKLQQLPINEAQILEQGQLIAQLDQRDFLSTVSSAKAQYTNAKEEYERAVRLAKEDAIAKNVLEQRKTQLDVSRAQLDSAEKALSDSTLKAPFKGVVAQKLVKNLQTVSAGQVVIKLMSGESFEASVDLPASFLATIPKQESDSNQRQAFVILDSAPSQLIQAEFKEASLLADASSQTYKITFTFEPPAEKLVLPGMNATVEIRVNQDNASMRTTAPLDAILNDGTNNFVWLINEKDMTVSKQKVTVEEGVGQNIVITHGLSA